MRPKPTNSGAGRGGPEPASLSKRRPGPHYAWVVLGVSFLCLLVAAAARAVPGVILQSLEHEFGWSRETVTSAVAVNLLMFGLAGPFLGRLIDLYGPRKPTLWTLSLIAAGVAGTLWMSEPWQMILLWGVVVGAGSGGASMIMGSAIANHWFQNWRGLALGILGGAMSAGQLIFVPSLMWLNQEFGWQAATLLTVVVIAVVALPAAFVFLRDRPEECHWGRRVSRGLAAG